jgi:hypothetical protein
MYYDNAYNNVYIFRRVGQSEQLSLDGICTHLCICVYEARTNTEDLNNISDDVACIHTIRATAVGQRVREYVHNRTARKGKRSTHLAVLNIKDTGEVVLFFF